MKGNGASDEQVALKLEPSLEAVDKCCVNHHFPMKVPSKRNVFGSV